MLRNWVFAVTAVVVICLAVLYLIWSGAVHMRPFPKPQLSQAHASSMEGLFFVPATGQLGSENYPAALQQLFKEHDGSCRFAGSSVGANGYTVGYWWLCQPPPPCQPSPCEPESVDAQSVTKE